MLLTTAYFPPVEYFSLLAKYSAVYLDSAENYQKQSYRNRCLILTANGPEALTFPIVHDGSRLITEVKVDYSTPWVRRTEYALDSAYYNSPFFEYYRDELFSILDSRPETLWDLNYRIIEFLCRKIGVPVPIPSESAPCRTVAARGLVNGGTASGAQRWDEQSEVRQGADSDGYRAVIHPKVKSEYVGREYWQVFREKFGFVGNLSVADLLFNEGPESLCYLK